MYEVRVVSTRTRDKTTKYIMSTQERIDLINTLMNLYNSLKDNSRNSEAGKNAKIVMDKIMVNVALL